MRQSPLYAIDFQPCIIKQQYTSMRVFIVLIIVIAIYQAYSQKEVDMTGIPAQELKALQNAVNFKKTQANEQAKHLPKNKGFFDSLFGKKQGENNKIQFFRATDHKNNLAEQGSSVKQVKQLSQEVNQIMKNLPYEALLPRRRQPLQLLNKILHEQDSEEEQSENNPLKELDLLLSNKRNKNAGKKLHWQNPDFKDGNRDAPYMKIFGPKSKGKHRVNINQADIQKLLVSSMPSLEGGFIVKLSSVPYRRGIFLNIQYQTAKQQIYTIKAKYLKKTNQLQIINLTQINVLRKVEDDESNDEAEVSEVKQQKQEIAKNVNDKPIPSVENPKVGEKSKDADTLKQNIKQNVKESEKVDVPKKQTPKESQKVDTKKDAKQTSKQPQKVDAKKEIKQAQQKPGDKIEQKKQVPEKTPKIEKQVKEVNKNAEKSEIAKQIPKQQKGPEKQAQSQLKKQNQLPKAIESN